MKPLYESILDDEDVLISDAKKIADNPFIPFLQYVGKDLTKYRDELMQILDGLKLPKLKRSVKEYEYLIYPDFIVVRDANSTSNAGWIIYIRINDAFKYIKNVHNDTITIMMYNSYFNMSSLKPYLNRYKINMLGVYPGDNSIMFSV